jgi:hypothetical protein
VRCDDELNPPDVLDRGLLFVDVRFQMHAGLGDLRIVYHS